MSVEKTLTIITIIYHEVTFSSIRKYSNSQHKKKKVKANIIKIYTEFLAKKWAKKTNQDSETISRMS